MLPSKLVLALALALPAFAQYTPPSGGGGGGGVTAVTASGPVQSSGGNTPNITCTTCGVTGSPLSQFAATTSAQLAGVLSDETGTGFAVFSISPAFTVSPTTPTQVVGDNSTLIASDAFVTTAVNNAIAGVNPAVAVLAASTASLTGTYSNGVSGVGATFTVTATGAFTLDGISIGTIGQRVLLKNQSSGFQNGVYTATVVGTTGISPVFTRALDYDQPSDINSTGAIPVQSGTVNTATSWLLTSLVNTVGTDALTYVQFSLAPSSFVGTYFVTVGYAGQNVGVGQNISECGSIVVPPGGLSVGHIAFDVTTGDGGGAVRSDVGIYSASGTLQAHIGATSLNTTGNVTAAFAGGTQTIAAGKAYICFTTSGSGGLVLASYLNVATIYPTANISSPTSGGVLNSTITPPADNPTADTNEGPLAIVLYP
jgi:hypothetical protein